MAVLCQTQYKSTNDDAGISVYVTDISPSLNVVVSVKIDDVVKIAPRDLTNPTNTIQVSFENLLYGKLYKVFCICNTEGQIEEIESSMFAQKKPDMLQSNYRSKGGMIKTHTSRLKGVGF